MNPEDEHRLENDPVWDLLRQSPSVEPCPDFTDSVLRAARLEAAKAPWWQRFRLPLAFGGLATAAAALAFTFFQPESAPEAPGIASVPEAPAIEPGELAPLDEILREEALLLASENPDDYSDLELVALLTF